MSRAVLFPLVLTLCVVQSGNRPLAVPKRIRQIISARPSGTPAASTVWLVETNGNSENYSNGLRIDNRFLTSNHARSYLVFSARSGSKTPGTHRTDPAGIVFHSTQSRQVPFEPGQNGALKKIGESLLEYVQRNRAYHFVIDRFGRVYRVVAESDSANHAGYSVWSDDEWLYVNLNQSFLGMAFESQNHPAQDEPEVSPAQVRAAGMLIEMLRARYGIAADHCVTHAQVSVNPSNMQVGYHTDWASGFPFEALGLPDNYARPLPAIGTFGFEYNPEFLQWAGHRLGAAVQAAEAAVVQAAEEAGVSPRMYRKSLENHYRGLLGAVRRANSSESSDAE